MFLKTDILGNSEILDDEDILHPATSGGTYGPWPDWFIDSILLASPITDKDTKEGIRRDQVQQILNNSSKTGHISKKNFQSLVSLYVKINPTVDRKAIEDNLFNKLSKEHITFD